MSYKEFYCVASTLVNHKELTRDEKGVYFNIENDSFLIEPSFSEDDKVLTKIMLEYQISPYPRLPVKGQPRIEGDYIHQKKVKELQDGLIKSYGKPIKEKFIRGGIFDIESFTWQNNSKVITMETTLKELPTADGEKTEQFYVTKLTIEYFDKTHYDLAGKEYKSYEKIKRDHREKQMRKL
uniref:hypothetical protein n=1 Tax=Pedobacter sp. TaxID=1411316 RepID=UPI0015EEC341|nr:hypothetical protein [Pedobacter sp.]